MLRKLLVPIVMLLLVGSAACTSSAKPAAPAAGPAAGAQATSSPGQPRTTTIALANTDIGPVLADDEGRTLYAFTKDSNGDSACADSCIAVWPALTASQAVAGTGVDKALIRKTARTEGTNQVTYGEWPLYYYVGDAVPGDVNGQGLDGEWFAVGADGKLVKTPAAG
jgi:predicted lipoprotein with Yx(FWY)xxD motif